MGVSSLVEQLLPRHCVLCGARSDSNLCAGCLADLPVIRDACYRCGISPGLPCTSDHGIGEAPFLCGQCIMNRPPYDRTIAALDYVFPVNVLVQRFKFSRSLACGAVLSDRLVNAVQSVDSDTTSRPEFLVPVPLHPLRQFKRVYNQAELLACDVGKAMGIPVRSKMLRRTRRTRSQPGLTAAERQKNLSGAFTARSGKARHVAIVDDVMTTGATVSECARALKKAGVSFVTVWAAARAPDP